MDPLEKDEIPMLSATFSHLDVLDDLPIRSSQFNRTRSASISSMPTSSTEASENESVLVAHTGPLTSNRRSQLPRSNGPLYVNQKHDIIKNIAMQNALRLKALEKKPERYPSSRAMNHNSHPNDENNNKTKNEHLLKSGQLGMCNDPYCSTCPTSAAFYKQKNTSKSSLLSDQKAQLHNILYGDARSWAKRKFGFLYDYIPGVMNPHAKRVQQWNQFFVISCLIAIFIDPLFFFLLSVIKDNKCIVLNLPLTKVVVVFRSITDFVYLLHMLLQFRLAYVAPESRVVGAGELVDHPKKIAINYLTGYFFIDFFIVLPLPQIIIMYVLPNYLGSYNANSAKNLLRASVLVQYIPRLYRFSPLVIGQTPSGFIFESAWANFVINLLSFVLSGHVVGSCWYLLGLQRVNQCLRNACRDAISGKVSCMKFLDCGHGSDFRRFELDQEWTHWKTNENATACFGQDGFPYGIYAQAVNLTTERSLTTRYVYSLFWGFQQISTLAGNQIPSYFVWEVLFTMGIIGLGLLLFALLIGNMQNFLQSLGRRRLELSLRRRDFEQWMSHRRLPEALRRQVRQAERYNWAATRGVNEEILLELLPEDIQRDIRRHLFDSVKKVRIFALLDEPILDAICERLRQKTYIKESKILNHGDLIGKMVFIVRGKMESSEDGNIVPLSEGDVCGEELLTWSLEHSSVNRGGRKIRIPGPRLLSNRTVKCLTNVEAFTLRAADLEEVTSLFSRFLRSPRVQGAIRYESPYWRGMAAKQIQVAWRYRKKRLSRGHTETPTPNSHRKVM